MNIRKTTAHGRKRKLSVKVPTPVNPRDLGYQLGKKFHNLVSTDAGEQFILGMLLGYATFAELSTSFPFLMESGQTGKAGSKKTKSPSSSAASRKKKKKSNWQDPEDLCDADD